MKNYLEPRRIIFFPLLMIFFAVFAGNSISAVTNQEIPLALLQKLRGASYTFSQSEGYSLAISGNTLVVGAYKKHLSGLTVSEAGTVFVY
ncbi:MAG TPA: FG-GAP repeat protein, partial [Anaerolineales bacterium]|nr:FG-GAP repeat protein [Anaerolineales bacterium]